MSFTFSKILQKQTWVYLAFFFSFLLSTTVIIGWLFGQPNLVQMDANSVPMQFNTALCLFAISLAGCALFKDEFKVTIVLAVFVFLLAFGTLIQYLFEINLAIDELFVSHSITTHTSSPGRMAPNTAVCFLFSAFSLLWLSFKNTRSLAVTLVVTFISLILVISLLSILGYIFSIDTSYGWGNMTYMALQTAIGFLFFAIGLLLHIAFFRQAKNASVYYLPIIFGSIFMVATILFTNELNNNNTDSQDPILALKQKLAKDEIDLNWNNALLELVERTPELLQPPVNKNTVKLPAYYVAIYVERQSGNSELIFEQGRHNPQPLDLSRLNFYSAKDNHTAHVLGVTNSKIMEVNNTQYLFLKLPISAEMNTQANVSNNNQSILVTVDMQQFFKDSLTELLSSQDSIDFSTSSAKNAISLPFYVDDYVLSITYAPSEYSQSQNRLIYLVLSFGLFITFALVVITFFAQRSVYQTRRLLKQAKDREAHETEMQQSHLTLTLASDVAKLGIWRWNVETGELSWNERMFQIYETTNEVRKTGLLFEHWYESVHKDDIERANNSLQYAVEHNLTWEEEFRLDLPSGIKYIKATAICFKDNNSQRTMVFGGNLDVTFERELQNQLEQKTKQAEKDSKAKSQFLANMSHELRTPMNGVLGLGELLKNTRLTAKQTQYLDTMLSSAEKLLIILNDILDLSKIEAGEMRLEILCLPFEEVVADSLKSLATSAHAKGLDYHYHKAQNVPEWGYTDAVRLSQIITNIASNAIKFTDEGEITINITADQHPASQHDSTIITFEVCDTGIGLSKEESEKIFTPFSQADESITRRFGGTGLGLSIVQQLVSLFDGSIEIESELGQGTCVRFHIPMKVGSAEEGELFTSDDYEFYQEHASTALGSINCLVVDGNEVNRKWLSEMLHSWQSNVTVCETAEAGLAAWDKSVDSGRHYDALIVDRNVPDVDAFDFVRQINKRTESTEINTPATVFVMTTKNLEADLINCAQLNIDQHLIKPVKQSEVFNAVMMALGKKENTQVSKDAIAAVAKTKELKVLVAEDHPVNQMLVKDILETRGHQIKIVENGRLALEALESEQFDAILMDVQMPVMDGITATKLIRQGDNQADICIIGLTAKALKGDENICLDAGMNYYMTKPLKPQALLDILENSQVCAPKEQEVSLNTEQKLEQINALKGYELFSVERSMTTTGGDLDLLIKVLKMTSENIMPALKEIKNLDNQQDWIMLGRAVHKTKGMLANFCDEEFMQQMEQLIDYAEQENAHDIQPLVSQVVAKIQQFNDEITDFMQKSS